MWVFLQSKWCPRVPWLHTLASDLYPCCNLSSEEDVKHRTTQRQITIKRQLLCVLLCFTPVTRPLHPNAPSAKVKCWHSTPPSVLPFDMSPCCNPSQQSKNLLHRTIQWQTAAVVFVAVLHPSDQASTPPCTFCKGQMLAQHSTPPSVLPFDRSP